MMMRYTPPAARGPCPTASNGGGVRKRRCRARRRRGAEQVVGVSMWADATGRSSPELSAWRSERETPWLGHPLGHPTFRYSSETLLFKAVRTYFAHQISPEPTTSIYGYTLYYFPACASQAAPLEPRASGSAESRVLCYGLTAGGQDGQHQARFGQVLLKIAGPPELLLSPVRRAQ